MINLGILTQQVVLDALASAGSLPQRLEGLQADITTIRKSYRGGLAPPFDIPSVRAAYALGYFPHHATLAAAAFGATGVQMLGLKDGASIVVLGAGPGPEVVGLAQFLSQTDQCLKLDIHLVDREVGWRATREATIEGVLAGIKGFERSNFNIIAHEHDLGSTAGIEETALLISKANLVVMETLLTELPSPAEDGQLVDWLIDRLPHDGRILLIDLDRVRRYADSEKKLKRAKYLRPRLSSKLEFPATEPLPVIKESLFTKTFEQKARKKLHASIELYSRPDCPMLLPADSLPFKLNDGQEQVLAKLKDFLNGPDRIFILTGSAGTGKTALFPAIVSLAMESGLGVELMAPTGNAARRLTKVSSLGASTVHSAIYTYDGVLPDVTETTADKSNHENPPFELVLSQEKDEAEDFPVPVFLQREPEENATIYIIDEASLLGNRSIDDQDPEVVFAEGKLLSDLLEFTLNHPDSRLIFVGDAEQLPPVGEQLPPALSSQALQELYGSAPVLATLSQVMRQEENSGVLDLAERAKSATINKGLDTGPDDPESGVNLLLPGSSPGWLNEALIGGEAVVVAARNADVARWNLSIRTAARRPPGDPIHGDLVQVLRRDANRNLRNGDDLVVEEVAEYRETLSIKNDSLTLREARFRFDMPGVGPITFNSQFVEDLLYEASATDHKRITRLLFIDFKMRNKHLKPNTEAFNAAYESDPRVNALRVGYAYARTCHRAQGGEWTHVIVDFRGVRWLGPVFGRWSYTAVTRAKRSVWLTNLLRVSGPLGSDYLAKGASATLQSIGLEVTGQRPIQHGVQLTIVGGTATLRVNLYEKKGRPSHAVLTGDAKPHYTEAALVAINDWIRQEKVESMDPLPARLQETAFALGSELQARGYDLSAEPNADYQVTFTLAAEKRRAEAIYSYKSDGRITSLQRVSGDIELQLQLREALERAVP